MQKSRRSLTGTRIYQRGKKFYLYTPEAVLNPITGQPAKWHQLCDASEGPAVAKELARAIQQQRPAAKGNMPGHISAFLAKVKAKREEDFTGKGDPNRERIFAEGTYNLECLYNTISEGFSDFDVDEVLPVDVAGFVDQWDGRRSAVVYKSKLSIFFKWAVRRGLRNDNPCRDLTVDGGRKRKVLVTNEQFLDMREGMLTGEKGGKAPAGPMRQCYLDLCYLIFQRVTEIRLLRKDDIRGGCIHFTPSKTADSTGASVAVPITPQIQAVLDRAAACYPGLASDYVIHTRTGSAYTPRSLRVVWRSVAKRNGIEGITQRDIRPMAMTNAKRAGYRLEQLQVAATHADPAMTKHYIRDSDVPVSEVAMSLPRRAA